MRDVLACTNFLFALLVSMYTKLSWVRIPEISKKILIGVMVKSVSSFHRVLTIH